MKPADFLWIMPFFSFLGGYLFFYFLFYVPSIETPRLIGKNLAQTTRTLSACNLNLRIIAQKDDNELPDGIVIHQTPNPGQKIKPNQTLFCVISKRQIDTIPLLTHYSCEQIIPMIKKNGLRIKKYFIESKYPKGLCIGQVPAEQSPFRQKIIQLYISSGSDDIVLFPQCQGLPVKDVVEFLKRHNLSHTLYHEDPTQLDHECITCTVIDQKPPAGSLVNLSKLVQIQLHVLSACACPANRST